MNRAAVSRCFATQVVVIRIVSTGTFCMRPFEALTVRTTGRWLDAQCDMAYQYTRALHLQLPAMGMVETAWQVDC